MGAGLGSLDPVKALWLAGRVTLNKSLTPLCLPFLTDAVGLTGVLTSWGCWGDSMSYCVYRP